MPRSSPRFTLMLQVNASEVAMPTNPKFIRWIPIVVPLSALVLVLGIYLIAGEVLVRIA
jgi:hypothetical protein